MATKHKRLEVELGFVKANSQNLPYVGLDAITYYLQTSELFVSAEFKSKQLARTLLDQRDAVYEDIAHHLELRNTINTLQKAQADKKPLKTKVDLGCNFYCSAKVDDPSRIFVRIGFGFYLEMTHPEALRHIAGRVAALEERAKNLGQDAVAVRAKIDMVLEALRELQGVQRPGETAS